MKILYVEAEPATRDFILEVISQENIEVEVCTSSVEALQILEFENYDLIISDFRLPKNGGIDILRKLIEKKKFPKVVYFSSVRPRKSKNLRKLLKRQNIFYVPRGMTSDSINGLSNEINNYEAGFYQRMFEAYMFQRNKKLNSENAIAKNDIKKNAAKLKKEDQNDKQKIKSLLNVEIHEKGQRYGNSVEDFGLLDLGDTREQYVESNEWDFESTRSQEELEADWEIFQKNGIAIDQLEYGFSDNDFQEESENDWGSISSNAINVGDDLDEDEANWFKFKQQEVQADWSIKKDQAETEELDYIKKPKKIADEHADWDIGNDDAGTINADWKIKGQKGSDLYADWEVSHKKNDEVFEIELEKKTEEVDERFPDYMGISFNRLKALDKAPCDIYLKLGDRKMLKMINENDEITTEFFSQMEEKGAEEMFLKKNEFNQFDEVFGKMLNSKLISSKLSQVEKIQVMGSQLGFDYVHKQMQAIGINDSTAKIARSTIENTLEVVLKDRNLLSSLKQILMGKSYISEHSIMAVTISTEILKQLNWMVGGNVDKIAMAGLFHDSLISDDRLARINRASHLDGLSIEEKNLVLNHSTGAAKKLEQSKFVDQDVYKIVCHHHERPQGQGFPGGLQVEALSNLTCIFILAEEIVELLYTHRFDVNIVRKHLNTDYVSYDIGNFKKPLEIAKDIL